MVLLLVVPQLLAIVAPTVISIAQEELVQAASPPRQPPRRVGHGRRR